jgi:hypothetical protein
VRIVLITLVAAATASLRADSIAIPLVDPADPVRIVAAAIDVTDPAQPAMVVQLENTMAAPIGTRDIWFEAHRFFTRSEVERAGDHKISDCGLMAAFGAEPKTAPVIAARGKLTMRVQLPECRRRDHEHFYVMVERLGHRFSEPFWTRDPNERGRLLAALDPVE